jgi:hypothetical protein
MKLNRERGVEEEYLIFEMIDGGTRGLNEIIQNPFECPILLSQGNPHYHGIKNKLIMREGGIRVIEIVLVDYDIGR